MSDLRALPKSEPAPFGADAQNRSLLHDAATFASVTGPPRLVDILNAREPDKIRNLLLELPVAPANPNGLPDAPVGCPTREAIFNKLTPVDRRELDMMRFELSVATGKDEVEAKQAAMAKFLTQRLNGYVATCGWEALYAKQPMDQMLSDSREMRHTNRFDEQGGIVGQTRQLITDRAVASIKDSAKLADFLINLNVFDRRITEQHLPDEQRMGVYLQLARVLDPQAKLAHGDAGTIARSLVRNASDPTGIDQGGHNTCNVTTIESRLYTREPASAAKVVADVALTGEFVTADKTVVRPPSMKPDGEASADPTPDGARNYASQIFQITAINVHWGRKDTLPGGVFAGVGKIAYCQGGPGEDPEYLLNMSKTPPEVHKFRSLDSSHPWLELNDMANINEQITGKRDKDFALQRWFYGGEDRGVVKVDTLEAFKDKLEQVKRDRGFPIILSVDGAKKPFGGGDGGFGPHVVTITDYDIENGLVTVDNQWGRGGDHTGNPGEQPKVPVKELFKSMSLVPGSSYIWDHIKRNVKDIKLSDSVEPTINALSYKGFRWGASAAAPLAVRGGLEFLNRQGVPYAGSLLTATESGFGKYALRAGTTLGAFGVAAYMADLPDAFSQGPARGIGRLTRVGVDTLGFELGGGIARGALWATGVKFAPARVGLILAAGAATATVLDRVLGDSAEVGGSYAYDRVRDWWKNR